MHNNIPQTTAQLLRLGNAYTALAAHLAAHGETGDVEGLFDAITEAVQADHDGHTAFTLLAETNTYLMVERVGRPETARRRRVTGQRITNIVMAYRKRHNLTATATTAGQAA